MEFQSFMFNCSVNTDVTEACFNYFSEIITEKTVVIVDNAPVHTSCQFKDNLEKWEEKGLSLKYLPAYSPELNKIEILWIGLWTTYDKSLAASRFSFTF